MDECESLHGFGIEMSLYIENWKFLHKHRSVQAFCSFESMSMATIDLEKALSRAIFMVGKALGKCLFQMATTQKHPIWSMHLHSSKSILVFLSASQ